MSRVVITGAGTINPLGEDVPATWAAMAAGRCAIGPLDVPGLDRLTIRVGAQVRGFDPARHVPRDRISQTDRFAAFALVAARQAVAQAGLDFSGDLGAETGVILGTAGGGLGTVDDTYRAVYAEGRDRVHPLTVPRLMHAAAVSQVSMEFGLSGPCFPVSSACASSNHALALAVQQIRAGTARVMLAGGSEAMLSFGGIKAWEGLRVLSAEACRPFSRGRTGMVQGEGAAVFLLERLDDARARGATILAEIAGIGMTADASDIVMPTVTGPARAMTAALRDAGLAPGDIGYVNAHGSGTQANDRVESAAIAQVFGAHAAQVPVSSTKSMHGHLIGATGAVELLACLMALQTGVIAPTVGWLGPDPDCPLDVVPNVARQAQVQAALTNAFAFGGLNAVLALKRV